MLLLDSCNNSIDIRVADSVSATLMSSCDSRVQTVQLLHEPSDSSIVSVSSLKELVAIGDSLLSSLLLSMVIN